MKKSFAVFALLFISNLSYAGQCRIAPPQLISGGTSVTAVWDISYSSGPYRVSRTSTISQYWRVRNPNGVWMKRLKDSYLPDVSPNSMTDCFLTRILLNYFQQPTQWSAN